MNEPAPIEPPASEKAYRMAIRRPVTMVMIFLTVIVFGWRSYNHLPVNLMPDISYPTLTVRTEYEGAAPEDVEKLVTRPLEAMLSIVGGLVEISSVSSPGLSEIVLEFTWGTDMNTAQQDVRDRLDIFEAPDEVTEKPVILRFDPTLDPVIRLAITSNATPDGGDGAFTPEEEVEARAVLTSIRDAVERRLKSDLEAKSGIAQVEVKGGQEQEIQILVDAQRLKGLGLTLDDISVSLSQQNINLSGGSLQEGKTEYLVRTLNEFKTVEEIGQSLITTPMGGQFTLADVAEVFLGEKELESVVRINGQEAVALEIFKEGDANTVEVCNLAKDLLGFERELGTVEAMQRWMLAKMKAAGDPKPDPNAPAAALPPDEAKGILGRLPDNVEVTIISDQSRFINSAISEVQDAAISGGLLALLVLFLFLKDLKSTVIIGLTIPISVLATFVPMYMAGISGDIISLNIMSLGGLALGIGNLVDNAIVVLESVFRCREEGDSVVDAAERGTQEVAGAVTSSTFTTVAVFFPVAFVEGIAGQLFRDLALTVTFSQVASLLVALYLIPLVASRKGAHIEANRSVIWILRAFRENRDKHGKSVAASILLIPTTSLRYAVEFLGQSAREDLIPSLQSAAGKDGAGKALLSIALLPLLLPVFVLQLFLNLLKVIAVTFFFALTALLLVAFLLIRFLMNVILWLPLRIFDLCFETLRLSYQVILVNSLRFAPIVLLCAGLLAAHALYASRGIGSELVPPMKQGEFGIRVEGLAGTRLEETEARARRIEDVLRDVPEIKTVTVEIGQEDAGQSSETGENVAEFTVLLHDPERAAAMQDEIIDRVRNQIGTFATEEITFTLPAMFSFKNALEIQLVGDDLDVLRDIGTKALELVRTVPGVEDAELSIKQGYPEVIIELDRELLAAKGITPGQVAQRLRTEVQGEVATKFSTLGEKIDMRVRTNQRMLQSVDDLRRVSVSTGTSPIPLEAVATITVQDGPSEIRRVDQRQVALISANASGRDLASMSKDILAIVEQVPRPRDYYFLTGGQLSELQTSNSSLIFAMILAVFLVYVVMACEFESFLDPLLVMFSIPLAFIGVVYALLYTQTDLSIMVFLGGIILVGIVTNNAIVLVDYINILRRRGYKKRQAVIEAGNVRLRPILMTMITTVLGLVPMVASTGDGAELRRPLAVTLMAGLFCATMLTLVIIPAVYELFGERDKPETAS
jgi:HAE1 family hydrophobic/amphiphilic exporter-1